MARKIPKKKLEKVIQGMVGKAQELGWSLQMPPEEKRKAQDDPKFVYATLDRAHGHWKTKTGAGNDGSFVLKWGAEKVGFGEFTFYMKGEKVFCDTECMSESFVRAAFDHFLRTSVVYDPK